MSASVEVDYPHCVRGQIANPEVYPAGIFGQTTQALARLVVEIVETTEALPNGGPPRLVQCSLCGGAGRVARGTAAHALLVSVDPVDA